MPESLNLNTVIADLFPPGIASCFSASVPAIADLLPGETLAISGMIDKRLDEFRHGRYCAHIAMTALGHSPAAIIKGADRAPVWPTGLCGSISHSGTAAAAVVAYATDFRSLGLDMESADPLSPDIIALVCRPDENPDSDGVKAKLLFSIKEAIYKCLYPVVQSYIDFLEMEVEFNSDHEFRAVSHAAKCPQQVAAKLQGRFVTQAGYVISAAWMK